MRIDFEALEELVKEGQLEKCLIQLKKYSKKANLKSLGNDILKEQSRLRELNNQYNSGRINHESYSIDRNKIVTSTINFINVLEDNIQHPSKIEHPPTTNNELQDEKKLLEGVWVCQHSSTKKDLVYIWSLLPDKVCIVNVLDKDTRKTEANVCSWDYDQENRVIIQKDKEKEIKGMVEWISHPVRFKLTILRPFNPIMIYEKFL
jgi:hypothetical protein